MKIYRIKEERFPHLTVAGRTLKGVQDYFLKDVTEIEKIEDAVAPAEGYYCVIYNDTPLLNEKFLAQLAAECEALNVSYNLGDGFITKAGFAGSFKKCDHRYAFQLKSLADVSFVSGRLKEYVLEKFADRNVVIYDPATTYIDLDVEIGEGAIIHPMVTLSGKTRIGKNAVIFSGTELIDTEVGENVDIRSSYAIETKIKLIGIYLIPALILLGFLIVISWKRLKTPSPKEKIYFNRAFFRLFIICFLMLLIGLFSVKYSNVEDTKSFENKLVFNTLAEKINTLHQIKFKSHNQELNFINQNGTWILQEHPAFPVYQERMRHFLSILMEARFYEKRTADPKYLSNFGLTPIQSASSAATQITLSDTKGETLTEFELGKINIDIGRGAKGAYIKFPDQFQVWLIKADFIDLGQDWREWTYSSLWNLRFGRLIKTQKDLTPEQLTLLARDLLITPLNSPVQTISTSSPIQQLDILTENRDQVRIEFYQESEKIYVRYLFDGAIKGKHLQFFATYAKDKFYAISKTDMEQITHDITTSKHGTN